MKRLSRPLSQHLDDEVDEAALARVWARRRPRRSRRGWLTGMAVGAGLVLAAVLVARWSPWFGEPESAARRTPSWAPLEATVSPRVETLPDASDVVLAVGARVEPLALDRAQVLLLQRRGRVEYRVARNPERRFLVEAGEVSVEVTGTRFIVDRSVAPTEVQVLEGSVIVRGEGLPDHVMRLGAGESLGTRVREARPPETTEAEASESETPEAEQAETAGPEPTSNRAPASPSATPVRGPAERSTTPGVQPSDEAEDPDPTVAWLAEADRARQEGRFGDAVAPLEHVMALGGRRGALAAYTLGRLQMDELGAPAAAARALSRALALGLPSNLREPAAYRRFRALVESDILAARDAADTYLDTHPQGDHAEAVRAWRER